MGIYLLTLPLVNFLDIKSVTVTPEEAALIFLSNEVECNEVTPKYFQKSFKFTAYMENLEITDFLQKRTYYLILSEYLFAIFECSKIWYLLPYILHFLCLF